MFRLALICALLTLYGCHNQQSAELRDFAQAFRQANQADEIEPMLALYALNGSTEQTVNLLKSALLNELGMPISQIEFEALTGSPEETIHYTHNGIEYGPTIQPLMRMRVSYATEDKFESLYSIGKNDADHWRIVSSRPIRPNL
ncbi:hypothetical protein SH580_09655 [Coraliomargarita algicola]|uniref:Lipoprotein n=1 Tax=Coraliomargarita algicola TaxID=3092156 RepID=A0ABZ0RRU2_9BACT|nr:hypothetical protein [Coraliomargarita sp. J2-16]WPJ97974.1 hypothetical protein SH580_09655 [Coraliomargarita sp. J2-16]